MPPSLDDLDPRARRVVGALAAVDLVLRAVALRDLARRSDSEVRGSRRGWAVALSVVSSAGVLPAVYLRRARV